MADENEVEKTGQEGGEQMDAAALQVENKALQDRLLRALAEAENARRRAQRTADDARQYAVTDLARELLAVMDSLQLAIDAATREPSAPGNAALLDGIRATERLLSTILNRFGVNRVEALGAPFDPALHEAVLEAEDAAHAPGSVAQVIQDGYTIHDRLLRPARVVVARRSAESTDENASPAVAAAGPGEQSPGTDGRGH